MQDIVLSLCISFKGLIFSLFSLLLYASYTTHFTNRKVNPRRNCLHWMRLLLHQHLILCPQLYEEQQCWQLPTYKWGSSCNCFVGRPALNQQQSCKQDLDDQAWWLCILIILFFREIVFYQVVKCHLNLSYIPILIL